MCIGPAIFYLRNKTSVLVFYRRIKYKYEFLCVGIKSRGR